MNNSAPAQEITSTYFNHILNKNVEPLTVDQLPPDTVAGFCRVVAEAFPDEADAGVRRVRYLIPYILQAIDWQQYGMPLEAWQLKYYYRRDRFLEKTGLSFDDFRNHTFLMNALSTLGLEPEPTFEFLLFLKYYFDLRAYLRFSPWEQLLKLQDALARDADAPLRMDVTVGSRHFRFENEDFIKTLFSSLDKERLSGHKFTDVFAEGGARDKIRALDYYLVKTLLDYLPIRKPEGKRGRYTQAERNLALSILNLCGRLRGDDTEGLCSAENNATFDKLMRDFRQTPIPFAMELFL